LGVSLGELVLGHIEKSKLPPPRREWQRHRVSQNKTISSVKPITAAFRHAINNLNAPNDSAAMEII
jgi:hypothetical protein